MRGQRGSVVVESLLAIHLAAWMFASLILFCSAFFYQQVTEQMAHEALICSVHRNSRSACEGRLQSKLQRFRLLKKMASFRWNGQGRNSEIQIHLRIPFLKGAEEPIIYRKTYRAKDLFP